MLCTNTFLLFGLLFRSYLEDPHGSILTKTPAAHSFSNYKRPNFGLLIKGIYIFDTYSTFCKFVFPTIPLIMYILSDYLKDCVLRGINC